MGSGWVCLEGHRRSPIIDLTFGAFKMNSLPLYLKKNSFYTVYGGPYRYRPKEGYFGVKMAAEINAPCEVSVPTQDFQVPDVGDTARGLVKVVHAVLLGKKVYVGCMGGIGRTGLMLSLLAKAFGVEDPVAYVRKHYYSHAVETKEQRQFIADFAIPLSVRWAIWWARLLTFDGKGNMTRD